MDISMDISMDIHIHGNPGKGTGVNGKGAWKGEHGGEERRKEKLTI